MEIIIHLAITFLAIAIYAIYCYYVPRNLQSIPEVAVEDQIDLNKFLGRVKNADLPKLLKELLREHQGNQTPGFIYMYQKDDDRQDVYKIGRTSGTVGVNKRLKQWIKKCNKRLLLVKKWYCDSHELCEHMIHTELKLNGLWCGKRQCNVCKGTHQEFFRSNKHRLFETINFWVDFFTV